MVGVRFGASYPLGPVKHLGGSKLMRYIWELEVGGSNPSLGANIVARHHARGSSVVERQPLPHSTTLSVQVA